MDTLQCVIEKVIYHNEENGYSVVKASPGSFSNAITAVGTMSEIRVGSAFNFHGSWEVNPKYGQQFVFKFCEEILPTTITGIRKYLGSGFIKGIGPTCAEKIIKEFGEETLNVLDNEPERLSEVRGIGKKLIEKIKKGWTDKKEINKIMVFLQSYDVSISLAEKIFKEYEYQSIRLIIENPYRLADEIKGVGFKTADAIASKLGFGHERFERLRSGIFYTLKKLSELGHCFAYRDELLKTGTELLEVKPELINKTLDTMIKTGDVIYDPPSFDENYDDDNMAAIYLPAFYYAEIGTANRLLRLLDAYKGLIVDIDQISEWAEIGDKTINFNDIQMEAIKAAIKNKVLVLTGGPGTGKTATTLGIISAYQEAGAEILLAAPTGRAAKRMSEVTNMESKTIHRLLEMRPPDGFQRDKNNPLEGDVLIVDECSMIDISLMNNLLKAVPDNMTLILVGDVDQLPSVGAGKVLSDIIASGSVPVVKLEKIFRQAQKSRIITNAHKINHGEMPYLTDHDSDFLFAAEENGNTAAERSERAALRIIYLCTRLLPSQGINKEDIQVLTPMKRGAVGSEILNQRLQAAFNPKEIALKRAGMEYRINDRVMQIRNNYDKAVFNGDIGFIVSVNVKESKLIVNFDERNVVYDANELDELVLAYATTIHKSQGSEFPYVVMPLMMSHYMMLQRNLLYTGVTRAKKGLILVGEKKAVFIAVKNNKIEARNTRLSERLSKSSI